MKVFGERIRELRIEMGLSQGEVANLAGISRQALTNYESGVREPNFYLAVWFADFFGVTLDYLFGRTDIRYNPVVRTPGSKMVPVPQEWARVVRKLAQHGYRPEVLEDVLSLLEEVVEKLAKQQGDPEDV